MTSPTQVRGIDVSNHQGWIDWAKVAQSGVEFAFIKATEGLYFNDPWFARNWDQALEHDLYRGAYHFARPSLSAPDKEAQFFLHTIQNAGPLQPGDMLVLDMEDVDYTSGGPYGSAEAWSLGFLEYVEDAVGFKPIFYSGSWYLESRGINDEDLSEYPLWLAAYQTTMPPAPQPWKVLSFWQYADDATIFGVSGLCDVNLFNGSLERLPLLGLPDVEPIPPTTQYTVGAGIQATMDQRGDTPASNEFYVTPDWSEAFGASGTRYVYIASLNQVRTFSPDA